MLPSAEAIFVRAQTVWVERATPPYESFRIACAQTYLSDRCNAGDVVQFTVRMSDGRTFAQTVATPSAPSRTLLVGDYISGPDGTPLGFYRALPRTPGGVASSVPPNLAPDPIVPTIAVATAIGRAYDIRIAGVEEVAGYSCYYLVLRPLSNPHLYALRELWIDESSDRVVRLIYAHDFGNGRWGSVDYRFGARGDPAIWTIVHIEADAPAGSAMGPHRSHVASDLEDISFPATMPDADFSPSPKVSCLPSCWDNPRDGIL